MYKVYRTSGILPGNTVRLRDTNDPHTELGKREGSLSSCKCRVRSGLDPAPSSAKQTFVPQC
jgi:hypothetical protein